MGKLRSIAISRGVRRDDAEDIVQEAFVRLEGYVKANEVRSKEAFLVSTVINIATDERRRHARSSLVHGANVELVADSAPQPDEMLGLRERLRHLLEGLEHLNPQVKRILIAHRVEGLTFHQIATRENLSRANVQKKVARAVMFLMKWLKDR